ncbi:hypothetical protein PI124_g22325 [Phytophthora idaei]|nr:hypothetical protein PI125_g2992 [Phytophthora idaei]KAG3232594.1 hypothetical protein PI124_g22325 [Phytophthora idaei]
MSERVISMLALQIETVARISVGMQLGSPVRGNKRIYARFVAARSLQEAAQATTEVSLTKETMRRESAQMACSSARRELEQTQREVHHLRECESSFLQELDAFNAQKEIFKATVATATSQLRRLHQLVSDSDIADDSGNTRLERRNEDLREQVKRLSNANKALRAHARLEEMDPDVLVLVLEGSSRQFHLRSSALTHLCCLILIRACRLAN